MSTPDVLKDLERVESLPTLPAAVTRVIAALDEEDACVEGVAELVSQDPAITGQVLRLANSVFYSLSGFATTSIQDAVRRIGFRELRRVVLSLGVVRSFQGTRFPFDYTAFWKHCFTTALAAGKVAAHSVRLVPPGAVRDNPYFLAGLLHDAGVLLLAHHLDEAYVEIVANAAEAGRPLHGLERERLGADHQDVGAALIRRWGLPLEVAAAAELHHRPAEAPAESRDFAWVVHVANAITGARTAANPVEQAVSEVGEDALAELGIAPDALPALLEAVDEAADASDVLVSVALSSGDPPGPG